MHGIRMALAALALALLTTSGGAAPFPAAPPSTSPFPSTLRPPTKAPAASTPFGVQPPANLAISLPDVIATVEKSYLKLSGVTADFAQVSFLKEKQREMRAVGQMMLKTAGAEPLMFRFDYFSPTQQQIICDGTTLWIYLPENRQVILNNVRPFFSRSALDIERNQSFNFLQGLGRISKDFQIMYAQQMQDVAGNYILELSPRRSMAMIQKLFLVVNRNAVLLYAQSGRNIDALFASGAGRELGFPLLSTTMYDHDGNSTIMEFSNIQANIMLPDIMFRFDVPADVQVVKPPKKP
jgi:outer membrane lipoprotein-sorting protein